MPRLLSLAVIAVFVPVASFGEETPLGEFSEGPPYGFRSSEDPCVNVIDGPAPEFLIGPNAFLVACPSDYGVMESFIAEMGAREIGGMGDYTLFYVQFPVSE